MDTNQLPRCGTTPIVRESGGQITYLLWIGHPTQPCDALVIRCCEDGTVLVSIPDALATCKGDTSL